MRCNFSKLREPLRYINGTHYLVERYSYPGVKVTIKDPSLVLPNAAVYIQFNYFIHYIV